MQRELGRACVGWRSLGKRVSLKLQDELHGNRAAGHQGLLGELLRSWKGGEEGSLQGQGEELEGVGERKQ